MWWVEDARPQRPGHAQFVTVGIGGAEVWIAALDVARQAAAHVLGVRTNLPSVARHPLGILARAVFPSRIPLASSYTAVSRRAGGKRWRAPSAVSPSGPSAVSASARWPVGGPLAPSRRPH